jgi:hypothetical protein
MASFRHPWPISSRAMPPWPDENRPLPYPAWNTPLPGANPTFLPPLNVAAKAAVAVPVATGAAPLPRSALQISGAAWVAKFPTSRSLSDLTPTFSTAVTSFIAAITAAGGSVTISATYRPPERAYLMHYAWAIAKDGTAPGSVPAMTGVDIDWAHLDASGKSDQKAALKAAADMVSGYGMAHSAVLVSRHTQKRAIDMTISGVVGKSINDASGKATAIKSLKDLNAVGKSYGVVKLVSDPPHWSDDGH